MEFLLWIIIGILLIGFGFAPVVYIVGAIGVVYIVLVILGKIFMFFAEIFVEIYCVIFIEPKRAQPKIKAEEVKEVKRFPEEVKEHNEKEAKEYNEKVDKITDLTLASGFLAFAFLFVLITVAG